MITIKDSRCCRGRLRLRIGRVTAHCLSARELASLGEKIAEALKCRRIDSVCAALSKVSRRRTAKW